MKTKAIIYTLIMFILFSTVQNLYAQNPVSNSTLQLGINSKLKVVSSFFPIDQFVGKVGGEAIERMLLIPKGVEPHDYEPTIKDIQRVDSADVLVYNGLGFEDWIGKMSNPQKIDASKGLNASYLDERNMTFDPHVWLDPLLAKKQVENIRDGLIMIDPNHKDIYVNNSNNFLNELDNLDEKIRTDLESCKKKDFITFHNSFSYFAKQYGLNQHSISNTDPESEVTPARLTEIINIVKTLGLQVIYSEELVDPRQATVIAQEVPDGKVLVLSPIEGLSENEQKAGLGYIDKMNDNINNLMVGLQCNQ
ncbi:MAG: zinc ABC transporter substrate-binding protein [Nitrososphaeraceae archaeon]|nr:zinc ABC transporter substrate-binding protein [Nitrososphaeraceae archaeon]